MFSNRLFQLLALVFGLTFNQLSSAVIINYSGAITADAVWSGNDTHWVTSSVTVNAGVTLTIEPGAIVKFNSNQNLDVNGVLSAIGSEINPIIFTSYRDDSVGGDTNADGFSSGQPGDWYSLQFNDSVIDSLTRLENVEVRYGGGHSSYGAIRLANASPAIVNSVISDSQYDGIYMTSAGSAPLIENVTIEDIGRNGVLVSSNATPDIRSSTIRRCSMGVRHLNGSSVLDGNLITDNSGWGIYYDNNVPTAAVIANNTVTNNNYGVKLPTSAVPNASDGNTLLPNDHNGIWIIGGNRANDLQFELLSSGSSELNAYHIEGTYTQLSGSSLSIDPGVIVKFADGAAGLTINGGFQAIGTANSKIVFTSERDDQYGGDLNSDGDASYPVVGLWSSIYFTDSADDSNAIDHAIIRFGGNANGALYAYRTNLQISNSQISQSKTHSIRTSHGDLTLENNEIFANRLRGISLESSGTSTLNGNRIYANAEGIGLTNTATASIQGNELFGNTSEGLNNDGTATVDAQDNWWGAVDGPGGEGPGSGDAISGNVDITNLLGNDDFRTDGTEFSYFNAGEIDHRSFGLVTPIVSGIASTELGTEPGLSFLYDAETKQISAEYTGLSATANYRLLFSYVDVGGESTRQQAVSSNQITIHRSFALPASTKPTTYEYRVPRAAIASDNLQFNIEATEGYRAKVSGLFLISRP